MLLCYVNDRVNKHHNYDLVKAISYIQYIKNTSLNRTIKLSPYKALFGQDPLININSENVFKECKMEEINDKDAVGEEDNNDKDAVDEEDNDVNERINNLIDSRKETLTNIQKTAQKSMCYYEEQQNITKQ